MSKSYKNESIQNQLKHLEKIKNHVGQNHFDLSSPQKFSVQILPDKSVSITKFRSSKTIENTYLAHPKTIRALKKDIFAAGSSFEDLEEITQCEGCSEELDRQFWFHCPFCEASF